MKEYRPINVEDLPLNAWKAINDNWFIVCAGGKKHHNFMTCSWGTFGTHWDKPTVTLMLRPQRYTRGFVEKRGKFSINIMPDTPEMKEIMEYAGTVSGRDEDKAEKTGLSYNRVDKVPSLDQARYVLNCEVIYRSQIEKGNFMDDDLCKEHYPDKDYHYIYIGEIKQAYELV